MDPPDAKGDTSSRGTDLLVDHLHLTSHGSAAVKFVAELLEGVVAEVTEDRRHDKVL